MLEEAANQISDRRLLQSIAVKDQDAFAELYHRYERPLFNYILRLVHEQDATEDLLQETFLAVWDGAGKFRGCSRVKTWLYRIAHNKAVTWLRQPHNTQTVILNDGQADLSTRVETRAVHALRRDQTRVALDQLTPEQRSVVELCFYHGMSYREISEVLNCPVGTVKSRMAYARRVLAAALSDLEPED